MAEKTEKKGTKVTQEVLRRVYVGPSIPYGKLRTAMVLTGTEGELEEFWKEEKERYPEIRYLMVPVEELPEAMEKVNRKGTILHKYYGDMLSKMRAGRKG